MGCLLKIHRSQYLGCKACKNHLPAFGQLSIYTQSYLKCYSFSKNIYKKIKRSENRAACSSVSLKKLWRFSKPEKTNHCSEIKISGSGGNITPLSISSMFVPKAQWVKKKNRGGSRSLFSQRMRQDESPLWFAMDSHSSKCSFYSAHCLFGVCVTQGQEQVRPTPMNNLVKHRPCECW